MATWIRFPGKHGPITIDTEKAIKIEPKCTQGTETTVYLEEIGEVHIMAPFKEVEGAITADKLTRLIKYGTGES